MNKTVLVTGGAGYVGAHGCKALAAAGYQPVVFDNLAYGHEQAVRWGPLERGDIADRARLDEVFELYRPLAVMHFAAFAYVGESVTDPGKYYRNNVGGSLSLIEAMVFHGVDKLVFSSTCATYGEPQQMPIRECEPQQPINPYGMSKLMTEIMLKDTAAAHPINYCALRYFNVAGADPGGRSGQSTAGATHLIKIAVEAAIGKRDAVSVYGTDYATPDGTGVRDYIHVSDLADAHLHALEHLIVNAGESLTMNCGYGRGYSVLEVLDTVDRVTNRRIERRMEARRAGDPDALVADNGEILSTLAWRPQRDDLGQIVADALAWERKLAERQ